MIVEIMVEILSILVIATKEVKQGRLSELIPSHWSLFSHIPLAKYLKKLVVKNDIEDALKRLDKLTQEETRMATTEVLNVAHDIDQNVKLLIDGM